MLVKANYPILTRKAVIQQFGLDVEAIPQGSIDACFEKLDSKAVDYAVVPFENSTNGQVVFTYDLLRDWFLPSGDKKSAQFHIVAEQFVAIHHYLLSNATDLSKVTKLYSHPQVWGQVKQFLALGKLSGTYTAIDTSSTAKAAETVHNDTSNTSACISSRISADMYELPVKYKEIEDSKENTTRFLVLGYGSKLQALDDSKDASPSCITSFMFVLNHNDPGALISALNSFKANNINLTSINSRPSRKTQWQYVFFVEAEGNSESESMQNSITELKKSVTQLAVLGSFARSWRYNNST